MLLRIVCLYMLCTGLACAAQPDTWTIISVAEDESGNPAEMTFAFDAGQLSLSRQRIITWGGSSSQTYELLFSGTWAVAGQITDGVLVPDPYATFVIDYGVEQSSEILLAWPPPPVYLPIPMGHVEWNPGTPPGYVAPIILGGRFAGDGAATYRDYYLEVDGYHYGEPISGTLVFLRYATKMPVEGHDIYSALDHTFYVTPVPEPTSLLALGLAASGLGVGLLRRRR